ARAVRARPGEFVADEVSVVLREQPWTARCLIARTRRLRTSLPSVWEAFRCGDLDAEQVRVVDRIARRATEQATLVVIDDRVVAAAQTRTPKQLSSWLLRLVVACEPLAFEARHRRTLAERRVSVVQGADGIGYVTGEVSAADAAAIDAQLAWTANSLGGNDPRSHQQRRADLFADLLLGRLHLDADESGVCADVDDRTDDENSADDSGNRVLDSCGTSEKCVGAEDPARAGGRRTAQMDFGSGDHWLEVEQIDPDTGELLDVTRQQLDSDGEPIDRPGPHRSNRHQSGALAGLVRRGPRPPLRIGIVVPLSSLLGLDDTPAELADRSAVVVADQLRQLIADTIGERPGDGSRGHSEVLFTRLLTDDGGRLLDTTELGRYPSRRLAEAIRLRAGTCRFPTCTVPADRCDDDHHEPAPRGPTSAHNLDPLCRRHHRGKSFAWLASTRDGDTVDWTMPDANHYRCVDEPLPLPDNVDHRRASL
ncbi:MAG: HNH endonuclease, partial [Microlunatus sp.]|nr:HNH endonuclease [Microlunatus sp.]